MCNKAQLIGYLYGDLSVPDRAAFEAHVVECADCRQEVSDLRDTRQHLAVWSPPDPELHFQVVHSARGAAGPPPGRRLAFVPPWGLAAAASLLLIAGAAAIANLEVRYGADGLLIRTGWGGAAAIPPAVAQSEAREAPAALSPPAVLDAASSEQVTAAVATLLRRVQELEDAQRAQPARLAVAAAERPGISAPQLRKILAESESRQRMEIALRIEQIWRDINATRASDFVRVQQTVGPELQRQQRLIDNVIYRTSTQK